MQLGVAGSELISETLWVKLRGVDAAVISVTIGRNLVLLREMGVRIGLRYRLEINGRGLVVHFRCVLGGLHSMASCGAWGLFHLWDAIP